MAGNSPAADLQMKERNSRKWLVKLLTIAVPALAVIILLICLYISGTRYIFYTDGYQNVTLENEQYRYNTKVYAILVAGVDPEGELEEVAIYTMAPKADSIHLVIVDESRQKIRILTLNRDTITDIRKYTLSGKDRGLFRDHLALAFTYGNGGKISCINLCKAVSLLLNGIPIRDYIVIDTDFVTELARFTDPVEVVIPNDDLAGIDEKYAKGKTLTVDSDNIEFFLRFRNVWDVDDELLLADNSNQGSLFL